MTDAPNSSLLFDGPGKQPDRWTFISAYQDYPTMLFDRVTGDTYCLRIAHNGDHHEFYCWVSMPRVNCADEPVITIEY